MRESNVLWPFFTFYKQGIKLLFIFFQLDYTSYHKNGRVFPGMKAKKSNLPKIRALSNLKELGISCVLIWVGIDEFLLQLYKEKSIKMLFRKNKNAISSVNIQRICPEHSKKIIQYNSKNNFFESWYLHKLIKHVISFKFDRKVFRLNIIFF